MASFYFQAFRVEIHPAARLLILSRQILVTSYHQTWQALAQVGDGKMMKNGALTRSPCKSPWDAVDIRWCCDFVITYEDSHFPSWLAWSGQVLQETDSIQSGASVHFESFGLIQSQVFTKSTFYIFCDVHSTSLFGYCCCSRRRRRRCCCCCCCHAAVVVVLLWVL